MHLDGYKETGFDPRNGMQHDSAIGPWVKRWGGKGSSVGKCPRVAVGSPYIRCYEELEFEREVGDILEPNLNALMSAKPPISEVMENSELFDQWYFFANWDYWKRQCNVKNRLRTQAR